MEDTLTYNHLCSESQIMAQILSFTRKLTNVYARLQNIDSTLAK
jgi:hypothetical protein